MTAACVLVTIGATAVLTFTFVPSTATVGAPFEIDGTTSAPSAADVEWVISSQNDEAPGSGWVVVDASAGSAWAFLGTIGASGTFYAWARQPSTHAIAVSSPIIAS